jgi:hypothetical protein
VFVNFLINPLEGKYTSKPTDILVIGIQLGGLETCICGFDRVFPLVRLTTDNFTVGHMTLKAVLSKMTKHEKSCYDDQLAFIPYAFDTFDLFFLAPKTMNILKRV